MGANPILASCLAGVAELLYAKDLKSFGGILREGWSPSPGTKNQGQK